MNKSEYESSRNQERIFFDVYSKAEKITNSKRGIPFIYATKEDELNAMRALKGNAFLLWRYWLNNVSVKDNNQSYWISPKAIENDIGLTESQYRTAKEALIKQGFLTWDGNAWYFHVKAHEESRKPTEEQKKQIKENKEHFDSVIDDIVAKWESYAPQQAPKRNTAVTVPAVRKTYNDIDCNDFDGDVPDYDFMY